MSTIWEHTVFCVVSSGALPSVLPVFDAVYPRDDGQQRDPNGLNEFGLGLSATGAGSPTHYGAAFAVTEPIREAMETAGLNTAQGVTYWRATNPGGVLALTNHAGSQASIGRLWSWASCLAAVSLKPIPPSGF